MFLPSTPIPRRLLLWNPEKGERESKEASPEICRKMWKNARSRSLRKRSAPRSANAAGAKESLSLFDSGHFGTDTSENDSCYNDELGLAEQQEEEPRALSRKRRLSFEEEQDCEDSGWSRLRRKMLLSILSWIPRS